MRGKLAGYDNVEGDFVIMKGGYFFIGGMVLCDDDAVYLEIRKLKEIIKDAKMNII